MKTTSSPKVYSSLLWSVTGSQYCLAMKRSVTAIMTVFKRGNNFPSQMEAVLGQSLPVQKILVLENGENEVSVHGNDLVTKVRSDENLGVWARFSLALMAETEYIWILDDDFLPGSKWLENVMQTELLTGEALFGSRGLIFKSKHNYLEYQEVGTHSPNKEAAQVDIVGHNWIFKRKFLADFWGQYSRAFPSRFAGEDIHISYSLQRNKSIKTIVPPHPSDDIEMWGEKPTGAVSGGTGSEAISQSAEGLKRFEKALKHYRKLGFETVLERASEIDISPANELRGRLIGRFPHLALQISRLLKKLFRSKQ